jgi:phosphate transport system substrate-binding protein
VQLKGSETLRPLLTMCAEDFMSRRPHIDILVQGGGSGMGIAALLHGMVDVAMASRELTAEGTSICQSATTADPHL